MPLVVLLGGARSGKSRMAVELARVTDAPVTFVATSAAGDAEMAERIAAHRRERPSGWETVEEPYRLVDALGRIDESRVVVVDCLSLWVANVLEQGEKPNAVTAAAHRAAEISAARTTLTVVVSNEVGLGIVPATPLGRIYRDLLGRVNQVWVGAADEALLVVAGRALPLADAREILGPVSADAAARSAP